MRNARRALVAAFSLALVLFGCAPPAPEANNTSPAPKGTVVTPKAQAGRPAQGGMKGVSEDDIQLGPGAASAGTRVGSKAQGN